MSESLRWLTRTGLRFDGSRQVWCYRLEDGTEVGYCAADAAPRFAIAWYMQIGRHHCGIPEAE